MRISVPAERVFDFRLIAEVYKKLKAASPSKPAAK